jgi:hypothetical protein
MLKHQKKMANDPIAQNKFLFLADQAISATDFVDV